ncbi:discoidin domain-containing protein, partial [Rhodopseudomonas sp.]|uniref:discoidin domain-containing protein n=1 Tax=Rhodopseudomonas sp. TaxID=1078 RepID=UPI003B3AD053
MKSARIGYINKADTASLSVSSQVLLAPVLRLQDPHVGVRWQSLSGSDWFVVDLGSVQAIDCVRVMGLTATTARIRYSATDPTMGEVADTGIVAVDQALLTLTDIRAVTARYVRVDLTAPTYCAAGRV